MPEVNEPDEIEKTLFNDWEKLRDDKILTARLEQYSAYLQLADKIGDRRQQANSFYLTLNTGICAVIGFLSSKDVAPELKRVFWCIPLAGIFLSFFWLRLVRSYRQLNTGKFKIIHSMEKSLPFSAFKAEWGALGEGKDPKLYTPLSYTEVWVPRAFIVMYLILFCYFIPYATIWNQLKKMF